MIISELPLPQLSQSLVGPGLRLRLGPLVVCIRSPIERLRNGIALHYRQHEVAEPAEFADFRVNVMPARGIRHWIYPTATFHMEGSSPFAPLPLRQAFPLLEWGLNWCVSMHCHQFLILHAAVVERHERALILPAPPGNGKSTLCAALVARGWRLLSDELAIIDVESGLLIPLPRPVSLKNESILLIRRFWSDAVIGPVVPDTMKGSVAHLQPPSESVRLGMMRVAPGWIVLPQFRRGDATRLAPLSRAAAFMQLVENAFNYSMHGRRGFESLADVAEASQCFEFVYGGDLHEAVAAFDSLARAR